MMVNKYYKKWYEKNKKRIVEKRKEYLKRWYKKNKRKVLISVKEWQSQNIEKVRKIKSKSRKKNYPINSKKIIARNKAQKIIPLKSCCEICGDTKTLERHHWRYDKPLMVSTLCKYCHNIQHNKNKEIELVN